MSGSTNLREWAGRAILRILKDVGLDRPGFVMVYWDEEGTEDLDYTAYSTSFQDPQIAGILEAVAAKLRNPPGLNPGKKRPRLPG